MIVRLHKVDGKWPNLALMKLSAYHKAQGHDVDWWNPLADRPDLLLISKVFTDTPDLPYHVPDGAQIDKGGSGYNLRLTLPAEIEATRPDYTMAEGFPNALGFTSRGCVRSCRFCIVRDKEGPWYPVTDDIRDFWTGQDAITLLDNNLTADEDHFLKIVGQIVDAGVKVDFNQGLDIRLITPVMARLLAKTRQPQRTIHFAFDHIGMEDVIRRQVPMLRANGVAKDRLMFLLLIGFDSTPEEDAHRVAVLDDLGVYAFVMPYDRKDRYQQDFARWCNHKAIKGRVPFDKYVRNKYDNRRVPKDQGEPAC